MKALAWADRRKYAWLLALVLGVFFLYHDTYSVGFRGEDFCWLQWVSRASWKTFLLPQGPGYYRPVAANLPYFFFSQSPAGIFGWETIGLLLCALGAGLFVFLDGTGAWFGLLWLLGPFQQYPAFYLNAFDYRIYPVAALLFLHFLYRKNCAAALACLALAAFSKEQGMALFVAPLFLFLPQPRRYWLGSAVILATFLFFHGLYPSDGSLAGFPISPQPGEWLANAAALVKAVALGLSLSSWGLAWHALAWCSLFAVAFFLFRNRQWSQLRALSSFCVFMFLIYMPLLFLNRISAKDLGGFFWGALLFSAAKSGEALPVAAIFRLRMFLIAACAIMLGFAAVNIPHLAEFARQDSRSYMALLKATDPFLGDCDRSNQVVIANLEQAMGSRLRAENALWAFRWRNPLTRFYLLLPDGAVLKPFEVSEPSAWVRSWQAEGHPMLIISGAGNASFVVSGRGKVGCGRRSGT